MDNPMIGLIVSESDHIISSMLYPFLVRTDIFISNFINMDLEYINMILEYTWILWLEKLSSI